MKHNVLTPLVLASLALAAFTSSALAADPSFSLAWSEYPSWSVFGVAHAFKLIDGRPGVQGPLEKKWHVDIVLKEAEYDPCISMYGSGQCDAACLTDMDALNPALSRPSVVILPTSTSYGADALLVPNKIKTIKDLRGKKIHGLAKSVSEYCFVRNLEILGEKEADFKFSNMDPAAAAMAMQQKQKEIEAIIVWNPFVLETLNKRKDVKVLFDSSTIPNEIIDTVVMAQSSLDKPGGQDFACAVIDVYYEINKRIANPATHDDTLVALGEKFSHLDLKSMTKVVEQTKFYKTPAIGLGVMTGKELPDIMKKVVEFCASHGMTPSTPSVGYGAKQDAPQAVLRFDPTFIKMVEAK